LSAELATSCTNLADVLRRRAVFAGSQPVPRAIAIDESVYGLEHPEVAADLVNLGTLSTGPENAICEFRLRRALAIYRRRLGREVASPQVRATAMIYN